MTTAQEIAEGRGQLGRAKSRTQSARIFAIVGLIAALAGGATAQAQSETPQPRTDSNTPPPPAAAADTTVAPAAEVPTSEITTPSGTMPVLTTGELAPEPAREPTPLAPEEKREAADKMAAIDARYEQMTAERSERSKLTMPITLMSAGYAMATAGLTGALVSFVKANSVNKYDGDFESGLDFNNDDVINGADEDGYRRLARTAGAISAVGFGFGIWGSVMLAKRLKAHSEYEPELRRLQNERKQLRRQLDYSANASGKALTLSVSGRF